MATQTPAVCPFCLGQRSSRAGCPCCGGAGMVPGSGLGLDFSFGDMAKNVASDVMKSLPGVGVNLVSQLAVSKLTEKLSGGGGGGGASKPKPAAPAPKAPKAPKAVSKLPSWLLPVGIGVGAVLLLGGGLLAFRRK